MSVIAIAYHSITTTWGDDLAVRPDVFESQLQKLADRGYEGVTFTNAALGDQNRKVVAITFDDAFASVTENALPILQTHGWPATVFPVTQAVDSGEPMSWLVDDAPEAQADELAPLTWEQLGQLAELGWEIGSHSRTHRLLSRASYDELQDEIAGSREDVSTRIGRCTSFSYPWGVVSPRTMAAVQAAGYDAASGLAGRFLRHNPYAFPRFAITGVDDGFRFRLKTSASFRRMRTTALWDVLRRERPEPAYPR
jgi:peptidoglycan/xylan/chitin deacetylase (PgdA/CDA1 family)